MYGEQRQAVVVRSFFAAITACATFRFAYAPLERVSLIQQATVLHKPDNRPFPKSASGVYNTLRNIEGVRGLYRGNIAACAHLVANSTLATAIVTDADSPLKTAAATTAVAAFTYPIEFLRVRMGVDAPRLFGGYRTVVSYLTDNLAAARFFSGMPMALMAGIAHSASHGIAGAAAFTIVNRVTDKASKSNGFLGAVMERPLNEALFATAMTAAAAIVSAAFTHPFILIRTCQVAAVGPTKDQVVRPALSAGVVAQAVLANYGWRGLYAGVGLAALRQALAVVFYMVPVMVAMSRHASGDRPYGA